MQIAATAPYHHGGRRYGIPAPIKTGTATTASNNPTSAICAGDGLRRREEREPEAGGLN